MTVRRLPPALSISAWAISIAPISNITQTVFLKTLDSAHGACSER